MLRPVLDDHCKRPDTVVYLNVRFDHSRVVQGKGVIDIHVTSKPQFRVPKFYDWYLGMGNAYDSLHAIYGKQSASRQLGEIGSHTLC